MKRKGKRAALARRAVSALMVLSGLGVISSFLLLGNRLCK